MGRLKGLAARRKTTRVPIPVDGQGLTITRRLCDSHSCGMSISTKTQQRSGPADESNGYTQRSDSHYGEVTRVVTSLCNISTVGVFVILFDHLQHVGQESRSNPDHCGTVTAAFRRGRHIMFHRCVCACLRRGISSEGSMLA
jgi:hypothetical protein